MWVNFELVSFQNLKSTGVISIGQAGFLVVSKDALKVYEWDEDSETILITGVFRDSALTGYAAVSVTADNLNCWMEKSAQFLPIYRQETYSHRWTLSIEFIKNHT